VKNLETYWIGAVAACVCAVGLVLPQGSSTAQTTRLSRVALEEAIALGANRAPEPYILKHVGGAENQVVVGLVYTPYLRVAFLSNYANRAGRQLQPEMLPAWVTEPLVYIAFRWYCCDPGDAAQQEALAARSPEVVELSSQPMGPGDLTRGVPPVWFERGSARLAQFGADVPFDDIAVVAAFPSESLKSGRAFAIYKRVGNATSTRIGVIRAEDVQRWR
jgi:hypothetical protein